MDATLISSKPIPFFANLAKKSLLLAYSVLINRFFNFKKAVTKTYIRRLMEVFDMSPPRPNEIRT
jgi:hypothetical protein